MKKILFVFIISVMFSGAHALHSDFKSEEGQAELLGLYRQYIDSFSENEGLDFLGGFKKYFTLDVLKRIIFHLDIELSLREIKENYRKTGFVQFRGIDHSIRTLVIGCGNRPFSYFAGYQRPLVFDKEYSCAHVHGGAITVDPDPATI